MKKLIFSICFLGLLVSGIAKADGDSGTSAGVTQMDLSNCHCYEHTTDPASVEPARQEAARKGGMYKKDIPGSDGGGDSTVH